MNLSMKVSFCIEFLIKTRLFFINSFIDRLELAVNQVLAEIGRRKVPVEEIEDMILDNNWDIKGVIETICREVKEPQKKKKKPASAADVNDKPSTSTTTSEKSGGVTVTTQSKFFFFFFFFFLFLSFIIASPPENINQLNQLSITFKLKYHYKKKIPSYK